MQTPVTVTLEQAKELGRPLTMADSLILIECRPRRHKDLFIQMMNEAQSERVDFTPWNGMDEPTFEVETPCNGKE